MSSQIVSGVTEKVLTHEVGAGAPCLKCGDKCPGLDLHFWRKICRNCKCKQENHDVNASISSRGIDNIGKLLMQDSGDTLPKQEKKKESPKRSPTKQPPKQVTAKISAPPPAAPKPEKHVSSITHVVAQPSAQSQTAYNGNATTDKNTGFNVTVDIGGKQHTLDFGIDGTQDDKDAFPAPPPEDLPPPAFDDLPSPPPPSHQQYSTDELPPSVPSLPEEFQETVVVSEEAKKSPYVSPQRTPHDSPKKTIQTSNDSAYDTDTFPPPVIVGDKYKTGDTPPSSSDEESTEYEWNPPVTDPDLIKNYIEALPKEKQPVVGTEGAKYRKKQLMRQLPAHDQEPSQCHDLTPQETNEMQMFVKQYREKALGEAKVEEGGKAKSCAECREAINVGDPIVWAERAGGEKHWHPKCFICSECKELLVDLIYFYNDDKIYCGRHYCELHKPRCAACDELIFAPEYTQAEDSYWHLKHFCCWHCDQPLGGKNYVPHDNQPVCIPCYEKSFAHTCSTCKEIIAPNTEWVTFEEHHWHANPECFKCTQCDQSLVGKPCIPKGDMVFCCSKCKRERFPPANAQ